MNRMPVFNVRENTFHSAGTISAAPAFHLKWIYETTESQAILPTPPLPPLYSLHPTLWDEWVSQKHNAPLLAHWFWRTHTHTEEWLYHKDNNSKETVKDIFHIIWMWLVCQRARVRVCTCACFRACPRFALWHFIPTFFLLLSFSLSSLRSSLSLSLCLLMTQRCAKNFLCSVRTHYCKPISHTEVYTRSRSRTLAGFITLEKWVVSGKKNDYMWGWGLGLRYPSPLLAHKDRQWTVD